MNHFLLSSVKTVLSKVLSKLRCQMIWHTLLWSAEQSYWSIRIIRPSRQQERGELLGEHSALLDLLDEEAGDGVLLERQVVVAVHVRQLPDAVGIFEIKFVEKSQGNSKQGVSSGRGTGLGWLRFRMFHHPAWAVDSYSNSPPARGTPQSR